MSESSASNPAKKWIIIAIAFVGLVVAMFFLPLKEWKEALQGWLDSIGYWGPVVFIAIYALATVFLIPASVLTLAAGLIFGVVWGSLWVVIGSNLGAILAFLVGRYIARDKFRNDFGGSKKFKALEDATEKEGWKIVGLTRLSPVFPFTFLNYAFSLTKVPLIQYALASLVGMFPGTVMYVYIGAIPNLAADAGDGNTVKTVSLIVGGIATVILTIVVTRMAKKSLSEKADLDEIGDGE